MSRALFGVSLLALLCLGLRSAWTEDKSGARERVFELRTYVAAPGKLEALNARFRNHTNKLFQKHGMELIGYWTPTDGEAAKNTLVYILAHKSREAAKKSWEGFSSDPEWNKARTESEKDGKLVENVKSELLKPTDYSPIR